MTTQKTLTPFTAAELELCFQVLNHSLAHPCHKCLELEALTDKVNFFRLKAKGIQENNMTKVFPHGIKKKRTSKFEETSTDTAVVDIPAPTQPLLERLENLANKPQKRTYNKSRKKGGLQL